MRASTASMSPASVWVVLLVASGAAFLVSAHPYGKKKSGEFLRNAALLSVQKSSRKYFDETSILQIVKYVLTSGPTKTYLEYNWT